MFKAKGYSIKNYSFSILIIAAWLASIGLIVLQKITENSSNASMFEKQLLGMFAGLIIAVLVSFVDYHFICKFCIPLYFLNIALMLVCKYVSESMIPFFYGKSVDEARRWIHIGGAGGTDFMPSEISKIVIILCLARLFIYYEGKINKLSSLAIILMIVLVPLLLVFTQPDLSTTIVIASTIIIMLFIAGLSYKIIIPVMAVIIPLVLGVIWYVQQDYADFILKGWQKDRILAILHPEDYPDLMYQQNNAASAMESGSLFGKMITGNEEARLTRFVPVVESDFIFSGVGEELGFVGAAMVIILFMAFLFVALRIALDAKDKLGMYISSGIASMITIQALVNIGVVTSLLPNTGIPLPFMSSGLSSLLTNFATIGILINIGLQNKNSRPIEDDDIVWGKFHKISEN